MNFLSSHDGIGLLSAREILPQPRFKTLLETIAKRGGKISYKATGQGEIPYELNITYYDAINDPLDPDTETDLKRFMAACSIMLADKGVPAIYIHALLGSRNNLKGVEETGLNRMINREQLPSEDLFSDLSRPESVRHRVLARMIRLLEIRKRIPAFHHSVKREILPSDERLFVMGRRHEGKNMVAVVNVSDETVALPRYEDKMDHISGRPFNGEVEPYGVYFLE